MKTVSEQVRHQLNFRLSDAMWNSVWADSVRDHVWMCQGYDMKAVDNVKYVMFGQVWSNDEIG